VKPVELPEDDQLDIVTMPVRRSTPDSPPAAEEPVIARAEAAPAEEPCPRCGHKLVNPAGLGWCTKCGYCRSVQEEKGKVQQLKAATTKSGPSFLGLVEFFQMLGHVPAWAWILMVGSAAIVAGAFVVNATLPENSLARALWFTIQIGVSLLVLFGAQVWLLFSIAGENEKLSAKDLFLSFQLWKLGVQRLPETRKQVWVGSWAVTAGLAAAFIIGGWDYWYQYYKPKPVTNTALRDAVSSLVKSADPKQKSAEEVMAELDAAVKDAKKKMEEKKKLEETPDTRPTVHCVIIGYITDNKDNLSGLVVATMFEDVVRFGGLIRTGWKDDDGKEILSRLSGLRRPNPILEDIPFTAVWVKPEVYCEVHQSGWGKDGRLIDPRFKGLLATLTKKQ
jgi:hypothetical protein